MKHALSSELRGIEVVEIGADRLLVRHARGSFVVRIDADAAFAALQASSASSSVADDDGERLFELLRAHADQHVATALPSPCPVMVVGNGAFAVEIAARMSAVLGDAVTHFDVAAHASAIGRCFPSRPRHHVDIDEHSARNLFAEAELVVVALEGVAWAALAPLNRAALESQRGSALFVLGDPDAVTIVAMPARARGCLLCERLAQLGRDVDEDTPIVLSSLSTGSLADRAPIVQELALASIVRLGLDTLAGHIAAPSAWVLDGRGGPQLRLFPFAPGCPGCGTVRVDHGAFAWQPTDLLGTNASDPPTAGPLATVVNALERRGVSAIDHAVGSFRDHLLGTMRILAAWGEPDEICRAGLLHSVYGSDRADRPLFRASERNELRRIAGPLAERLVFLFCTIDRRRLHRDLVAHPPGGPMPVAITNWRSGETAMLAPQLLAALLVIEIANAAEQSHEQLGPGLWLARCSTLADTVHAIRGARLPGFAEGIERDAEVEARELYTRALACMRTEPSVAESLFLAASERNRLVGEPLVLAASLARLRGDHDETAARAQAGLARMQWWFTAWDKRAPWERWLGFGQALLRHGAVVELPIATAPSGQ